MRRMYSKEQLQKLIDEVSRLIAIEELDKVVPVPSLADAGKVMVVNAAGTGYELKTETTKTLYFHPISISNEALRPEFVCSIIVINDSAEPIDTWAKLTSFFNNVFASLPEGVEVARFPCTGFLKNADKTIVASVIEITGTTDATRIFKGMNVSSASLDSMSANNIPGAPVVNDGVNQIL